MVKFQIKCIGKYGRLTESILFRIFVRIYGFLTDIKSIEAFIAKEQIMRIAFYDNALMKQTSGKTEWQYSEEMMNAVAIYRVDVNEISCKAK